MTYEELITFLRYRLLERRGEARYVRLDNAGNQFVARERVAELIDAFEKRMITVSIEPLNALETAAIMLLFNTAGVPNEKVQTSQ